MIEPTQPRRAFIGAAPVFVAALIAAFLLVIGAGVSAAPAAAAETGPCAEPIVNPIVCENSKEGDDPEDWQIDGIGDESIQGFATAISVNPGETEQFKIKTNASKYNIRILRLGYYKGDGARVIEPRFKPSASLPQKQPPCLTYESTGLVDCGNWAVSASWKVPANAVSGLYMAELEREDTHGMSQIFFVVKNESSHAPIVLKTSDATWEAYNEYGKNSLYSCNALCPGGNPAGYKAAYAVSYNRPFDGAIPRDGGKSDPFYAEYQMMRWLEKEGYNVTYLAQPDIASHPELLKNHKVVISSGHDEYWTGSERAAFESAREAGVNLAFFSGNEVFWKTRWAPSTEGAERAEPDADHLQGDPLHRTGRSGRAESGDLDLGGSSLHRGWRRTAAERTHRPVLPGQRRQLRHQGPGHLRETALLEAHPGRIADAVADADARPRRRNARLRVGRRPRQRLPAGRAHPALLDHGERRRRPSRTTAPKS